MKKKLLILVGVLLILGFLVKTMMSNAETDQLIEKEWVIEKSEIDLIEVLNSPQKLQVEIRQTEERESRVKVEGKVAQKVFSKLEKVVVDANKLSIQMGSNSIVGLTYVPDGDEPLKVTILLGKGVKVKEYFIDSSTGIDVRVPKGFDGKYELNTNKEGEILSVPKTTETQKSLLKVDAAGDINITN